MLLTLLILPTIISWSHPCNLQITRPSLSATFRYLADCCFKEGRKEGRKKERKEGRRDVMLPGAWGIKVKGVSRLKGRAEEYGRHHMASGIDGEWEQKYSIYVEILETGLLAWTEVVHEEEAGRGFSGRGIYGTEEKERSNFFLRHCCGAAALQCHRNLPYRCM